MKQTTIITNLLVATIFILGVISCQSDSTNNNEIDSDYIESKSTLENKEIENPLSFITIDADYKKNLLGMWVIEGTVTNSATLVTYKDIELEVNFYSKTDELLGTSTEVIEGEFPAGETKEFKTKITGFKETKKIDWKIINASTTK